MSGILAPPPCLIYSCSTESDNDEPVNHDHDIFKLAVNGASRPAERITRDHRNFRTTPVTPAPRPSPANPTRKSLGQTT